MKKGEIYEGTVEKTEFPNRGIIKAEERRIIVKNTIPGQKIRYRIRKLRKGTGEGQLLEVLEPSPLETEPACPHFGQCGGCTYQNLPYEEQLRLKESQLRELLDGAVWKPYMFEGVKESPRFRRIGGFLLRKTGRLIAAAVVAAGIIAVIRGQKGKILAGNQRKEAEQFAVAEAPALLE